MASKKPKTKPPRGRPVATSQISQPAVEDSSSLTVLSSFSPSGHLFAFVSLAIDKHCLRVYDTTSAQSVAEHIIDSAKITALAWSNVDLLGGKQPSIEDELAPPLKKKRKKRSSHAANTHAQENGVETVLLGLSNGTLLFFSPTHGRILRTFSHATSTSAILSAVMTSGEDKSPTIWTSGADGAIRVWHAQKNDMLGSWKNDDRIPYSSMAIRPGFATEEEGSRVDMAVANHGIHVLSTASDPFELDTFESRKPKKLASFTGHASAVTSLHWDASQNPSNRLLSAAERDRFVYVWEVPGDQTSSVKDGKLAASIPLDSYARCVSLSVSSTPSTSVVERQTLLTVSASGKISVFPIPSELTHPSSTKTPHKIPTLLPRSTISLTFKKVSAAVQVVAASFVPQDVGQIRIATIVGGARPIFNIVKYLDESGDFIQDLNIVRDDAAVRLIDESQVVAAPNKRYAEPSSLAVRSGVELGQSQETDDLPSRDLDGDLDVNLAELSLGQRLTALSGPDDVPGGTITSDSDNEAADRPSTRKRKNMAHEVPANSLTRTLIQALHSSDSRLLEMCLAHSDPAVIRNTLRRLPPQLAVPLITACVERLGRGARASNMKGGGGGASSQRGTALIEWVKAVLAVHSGHLMTMPDLVARLSGLHATLTTRLSLQESLLSLSGRLDMVLSQIEMRSSVAPAPLTPRGRKKTSNQEKEVMRYVEGQSEEEEEEQMQVDIERDSGDEGSIEDVELGGDSQDEESDASEDDDDDDDEDEDDDEDDEWPSMNGFIDDEAEEYTEDEEDDDSE